MISGKLYTAGYGNLTLKNFIENLQKNGIQVLVDVRSNPFSRFRPEFNKKAFEITLAEYWIKYIHKAELGGKPSNEVFYDNGKLNHDKLRKSVSYLQAIDYLEAGLSFGYKLCVMCSELNYQDCHRYSLISEDMQRRGFEVLHIVKNGEVEPHQQIWLF